MEFFTLFLIAVALSMDAFAVSISNGLCYNGLERKHVFQIAGTFGFFQALMPLIGYFLGQSFKRQITSIDHWIALVLLCAIGIHMIYEAAGTLRSENAECKIRVCTPRSLFTQGIATSIDALAVGISFAVIETNIYLAVLFIGIVTFIISATGVLIGKRVGLRFGGRAEIIGGLILIGIGLKIFIEHVFFV
ncbi:MAG: manganese efflux pump MntP [Saccharofermentanales bacterium]